MKKQKKKEFLLKCRFQMRRQKNAGKKINFILLSIVEIKALVVVLIDNKDKEQKKIKRTEKNLE